MNEPSTKKVCTLSVDHGCETMESKPVRIDPARIPQDVKLRIGKIFYRAFMRDYETPEFQECYRQWQQEKAEQAAGGKTDG